MKLADLPDIDFVNINTAEIEQAIYDSYAKITGRTLAKGDPVRLFLLFQADVIIRLLNKINYTGKQNLLKYSTGENLDNLAANAWISRIPAGTAKTTLRVTLSAVRESATIIPEGTRVSPENSVYFATDNDLIIPAGVISKDVSATCTASGSLGNNYRAGEINKIVDPIAFVDTIINITMSEGGSDTESDESLRERVWEAPEALSVAGPAGAYKARTKAVSSAIVDVNVSSPEPGVVDVVPLLTDGGIPQEELIKTINQALSADDIRPLTDKVQVIAPTVVSYDINASYYITDDADALQVKDNVAKAVQSFISWEKARLGRDINPSRLIQTIMEVSGVKRVDIEKPVFSVVKETQVAVASGDVSVVMLGSEDE